MSRFSIIPAFNEEKNIKQVIEEANKLGITPIVVDDGSTDKTFDISSKSGAIVIRHGVNKGKGDAIKSGIEYLLKKHRRDFDDVTVMDADMQYHPREVLSIFDALEKTKSDFVMGYRNWREVPFRHRLGNFVWRTTFNIMFGTKLKDTNCGMMGFNRAAAEKLKNHILGGYIVDNSILIGAIKNNLKIHQVQVNVTYNRKSGVPRGVRMVLGVLLYILREGIRYRLRQK